MHEGRNRQIRRTFASLGYKVIGLHRTQFGTYVISSIKPGTYALSDT
jgi:23S rRNA pseudouridine2605 synthase